MDDDNRYWQPIICEVCKKQLGWAPYGRSDYQCLTCNNLPENWDEIPEWEKRYDQYLIGK